MAKKGAFRLMGLDPVFFIFHLLFLGITYTIYLAPHISPSTFAFFGLIPIVYPLLVLGNLIMIFLLFWRRTVYAILFLLLSIGLYPPLTTSFQYFGDEPTVDPDFKMITFNVHYLKKEGFDEFFKKQDADLIVLQEVYWRNETFNQLKDSTFGEYYHEKNVLTQFLSKYPIIEFKQILSGKGDISGYAAYADIDTGKDTIRIINAYLAPMLIDKTLVKETLDQEMAEENSKKIGGKLTRGFLEHEKQIKAIAPYIVSSKHPVILAGDLNAVPNSFEYRQILYRLKDAYPQVGKSSGTSFHDFKYPLRLDYIFHSDEITPVKYEVLHGVKISDHYPVVGHFKLP